MMVALNEGYYLFFTPTSGCFIYVKDPDPYETTQEDFFGVFLCDIARTTTIPPASGRVVSDPMLLMLVV